MFTHSLKGNTALLADFLAEYSKHYSEFSVKNKSQQTSFVDAYKDQKEQFFQQLTGWLVIFEWDVFDKSDYGILKWRPQVRDCANWKEVTTSLFGELF